MMDAIAVLGSVGDVFAWIGLGIGLPLLVIALIGRVADGHWRGAEVTLIERPEGTLARWYTAGQFWERPLRGWEAAHWSGHESAPAYVNDHNPQRMRFDAHQPALRAVRGLGITLTAAGIVGLLLSFAPALLG